MAWGIQFDFDAEGDPPSVYIAAGDGRGTCYVEVLEEPTCKNGDWSWDDEDWEPGELAKRLLEFMNREMADFK
jgi:hypothetical protein